jgi:ribosomal protein S18 acetylase RimI-like enzyme
MRQGDEAAVRLFVSRIPDRDRTFFKEDVGDPGVIRAWTRPGGAHSLALVQDVVIGWASVVPLHGWSSHVGEVRVIVDPARRGSGVGRALARHALTDALRLGLTKMVVEVTADEDATIGMFRSLGFDPEALLTDHVRDGDGALHDLMILAHSVQAASASLQASGLVLELN